MKLKAVVREGCNPEMQAAIESEGFYTQVLRRILVPHLHMKEDIGPAEFYIQQCDLATGRKDLLCEVRLSGVSVNKRRATNDFYNARYALERLYHETIYPFLKEGERLQLMVAIILDQPPFGENTTLIERRGRGGVAVTIQGGKPLQVAPEEES